MCDVRRAMCDGQVFYDVIPLELLRGGFGGIFISPPGDVFRQYDNMDKTMCQSMHRHSNKTFTCIYVWNADFDAAEWMEWMEWNGMDGMDGMEWNGWNGWNGMDGMDGWMNG
jgi:hypothetical protein